MNNFYAAVSDTIKNEGDSKYTETTFDKGWATKFGISLRLLQCIFHLNDLKAKCHGTIIYRLFNRLPTNDTVRYLTQTEAELIYKIYFWDANNYGRIEDQFLSKKIFDMAVLFGAPVVNKILQRLLDIPENKVDGIIGENTIKLCNEVYCAKGTSNKFNDFKLSLVKYCVSICNKDKSQNKFLLGWLNRIIS